MEGLLFLFEVIKKYLNVKYSGCDDFFIGLDIVVVVGNLVIIFIVLILIFIFVFIVFFFSGNKVLLFGDFVNLVVMVFMIVLVCCGNIFWVVIIVIFVIVVDLWIVIKIVLFIIGMVKDVNFKMVEGLSGQVLSFFDGGNFFCFWLFEIFNGNIIVIGLIFVFVLVIYGVFCLIKGMVYV